MKIYPYICKRELSDKIGISTTAIDKNIMVLKKKKLLKRIGLDKGGHWFVLGSSPWRTKGENLYRDKKEVWSIQIFSVFFQPTLNESLIPAENFLIFHRKKV